MKLRSFFLTGISLVLLLVACTKKVIQSKPTTTELAASLYTSPGFVTFAKNFILDFRSQAIYYQVPGIIANRNEFTAKLTAAGDHDAQVEQVFAAYGLSAGEAIARRNKVDNDLLKLFHENKTLLDYNESEVWEIIRDAINLGWQSGLPEWKNMQEEAMRSSIGNIRLNAQSGTGYQVNRIAVDEIWDCMKEAIGIGSASVLGIAGLQKLAQQGIQEAVLAVSGWLAKRAGWIGAAIVAIDFASCIYKESID